MLIAFGAGFFDWMENLAVSYVCREWPNRENNPWFRCIAQVGGIMTMFKYVCFVITLYNVVVGFVYNVK